LPHLLSFFLKIAVFLIGVISAQAEVTITTTSTKGWSKTETFNNLGLTTESNLSGTGIPSSELSPVWGADGSLQSVSLNIGGDTHSATFKNNGTLATLSAPGKGNILGGHSISGGEEILTVDGVTTVRKLDGTRTAASGGDVIGKTEELATYGSGFKQTATPTVGAATEVTLNAAGAPTAKAYAAGAGESYTSYKGGLIHKVSLARGGDLSFGYSNDGAKDLTSATWPAVVSGQAPNAFNIPSVVQSYGHDRAGRVDEIGDSSGARALVYQSGRLKQTTWNSGPLAGYKVVKGLDEYGRDTGFTLYRGSTVIHSAVKAPNGVSGEVSELASGALKIVVGRNGARQVTGYQWGNAAGTFVPTVAQRWQRGTAGRILLADSNSTVSGAPSFDYMGTTNNEATAFDLKGRRLKVKTAGADWTYQYTNGQITSAVHPTLGSFSYQFDGIGRRKNQASSNNYADLLNRTLDWENDQNKTLKVIAHPDARVWVNGTEIPNFTGSHSYAVPSPGASGGWVPWTTLAVLQGEGDAGANADAKAEQTGAVWVPPVSESFTYDAAGNRESSNLWVYGWNAKNELVRARTKGYNDPAIAQGYDISFDYDAEGRRFKKTINRYQSGQIAEKKIITFVWDGWDLLYERHQLPSGLTLLERKYLWGPDIAAGNAGGAGGLLLIRETKGNTTTDIYPLYDGTGHVTALTNSSSELLAEYAYGPFGEKIHANGPLAQLNPWRYATKYFDAETGLYYYGKRYLDPVTGQFLSREPLGESESLNLYSYCHNDSVNQVDVLGLAPQWMTDAQGKVFDAHVTEWLRSGNFSSNMNADIIRVMIDDGILPQTTAAEEERLDAYYGTAGKVVLNNPRYVSAGATLSSLAVGVIQTIPGTGPVGEGVTDGSNTPSALIFDTFRLNANSLIALANPGSMSISREYASFLDGYNKKYSYGQRSFAQGASLAAAVLMPEAVMQGKAALANVPGWSVKLSPRLNPLNYRVATGELYSGMPRFQFVPKREWLVGPHGKMPVPRPTGMQSHHGVNSVWMEANISGYKAMDAPAILMQNDPFHNATRGLFNRFRSEIATRQGVSPRNIDWSKVQPGTAWRLAEEQLSAAQVPLSVRQDFFDQMAEYMNQLR
jgi:RHS repeat-associated protein